MKSKKLTKSSSALAVQSSTVVEKRRRSASSLMAMSKKKKKDNRRERVKSGPADNGRRKASKKRNSRAGVDDHLQSTSGTDKMEASIPDPVVDNIFNREKLKHILKCLADQQQQQSASASSVAGSRTVKPQILHTVEDSDDDVDGAGSQASRKTATAHEIFNRERLIKIKTGLINQTKRRKLELDERCEAMSDDSDCCVVFAGPRTVQVTPTDATKKRIRTRSPPRAGACGQGGGNNAPDSSKTIVAATGSIFVNDKLKKILNGLQAETENTGRFNDAVDASTADDGEEDDDDDDDGPITSVSAPKRNRRVVPTATKKSAAVRRSESESSASTSLKERMVARLSAARFRYINEKLYTSSGADARRLFTEDPEAYNVYHVGYQNQLNKWPVNPLDVIVKDIKNMPKSKVVADFGCGDARLSQCVANKVHSFDLVALNERVVACNMEKVPLKDASVDLVVFCLSLMGTNLSDYIVEANRVLKLNGMMKIAEVQSRFKNVRKFQEQLEKYGFKSIKKKAVTYKMFVLMDFKKTSLCDKHVKTLPHISLQPCVYKKR